MANKETFTPDEWSKILESVGLSGVAVTAADPSGLIGMFQEAFASAGALISAKNDPGASELVKSVVAEFESSDGRARMRDAMKKRLAGASQAEASQRSMEALREVSSILDAKAPADAAAFKAWLRSVSSRVADAAKEGGILGFGGEQVSDKEKATLDDISRALGLAA